MYVYIHQHYTHRNRHQITSNNELIWCNHLISLIGSDSNPILGYVAVNYNINIM